ncbi:MAG: protease modulator HflC [Nevskia sp.]|nr:protease modulator HflC [Nevskia sp.]
MSARQSVLLVVLAIAFLLSQSIYVVFQRDGAILLQFDKIVDPNVAPGLHLQMPLVQSVVKYDRRLLEIKETETVPLGDQKTVDVEFYVQWKVADPTAFYLATGARDLVGADRLVPIVDRSLRDTLAPLGLEQIVGGDHGALDTRLRSSIQDGAKGLGIEIADARLTGIGLPKEVAEVWYDRMRAERHRAADELRARGAEEAASIRATADSQAQTTVAEAYRSAQTIRGEGDAAAADIYARSYGQDTEFFAFYRSLQAYRDSFNGRRDVLVLQPEGEFFDYFKSADGRKAPAPPR